jgi:hypothetical protein
MNTPRSLAIAALAAGTLAVAACGSLPASTGPGAGGDSPAASSGPEPSSPAAAVATASCAPSAVQISLDNAAAGVAGGSSYVPLEFENVSASPCTLPSYPDVTFASSAGGPAIGPPAVQQDNSAAQPVVLAAGQLAHAWLQIVAAANYPAPQCHPVNAEGLLVSLSTGGSPASFVADPVPACAQPPQGSTFLSVFPVRSGPPLRGTIP